MHRIKLVIAALLVLSPFAANADLIGVVVDVSAFAGSGSAVVVDPGVEFSLTASNGEVDIIDLAASSIYFSVAAHPEASNWSFFGAGGGDQFVVSNLDAMLQSIVSGATFSSSMTSNGVTASNLMFGDGFISFEIAGEMSNVKEISEWTVQLEFTRVPEPGTLALLGIGLAGLGLSRRRKV